MRFPIVVRSVIVPRFSEKRVTMSNSSLEEGAKTSVFGGCDVITHRKHRGAPCHPPAEINMDCAWIAYVFKDVRVRVYTARRRSASRFIFFDDDKQDLSLKPRKDTGHLDASPPEERRH